MGPDTSHTYTPDLNRQLHQESADHAKRTYTSPPSPPVLPPPAKLTHSPPSLSMSSSLPLYHTLLRSAHSMSEYNVAACCLRQSLHRLPPLPNPIAHRGRNEAGLGKGAARDHAEAGGHHQDVPCWQERNGDSAKYVTFWNRNTLFLS